jgi:hypothetical protein
MLLMGYYFIKFAISTQTNQSISYSYLQLPPGELTKVRIKIGGELTRRKFKWEKEVGWSIEFYLKL